jgi:hypothetical protein
MYFDIKRISEKLKSYNLEAYLSPNPKQFMAAIALIFLIGTIIGAAVKPEILPTFYIACITLLIVYKGSLDSHNKLRLELFKQRYEIYQELIKFSSRTLQTGKVEQDAIESAHNSFRGLQYHASLFLFGEDIHAYFKEINHAFSSLTTYGKYIGDEMAMRNEKYQTWMDIYHSSLQKVCSIPDEAPKIFAPYLYFGDVKDVRPR